MGPYHAVMATSSLPTEVPVHATRVGVFGGTFDPPHNGHLLVAAEALWALRLDVLLLVVAARPWQKVGERTVSSADDRLAMVEAMCKGVDGLRASRIEIDRGGPSYTADTLRDLEVPGRTLFLVLGRDAAAGLPSWERVEEVQRRCVPVLVDRPGIAAPDLPDGWVWERVATPRLDVSSTDLRRRFAEGRPVHGLMPPGAISCARQRGLYGDRP